MKFRTRLYLFFVIIAAISILSTLGIVIHESRGAIFEELQGKVVAVAATTAAQIPGDHVSKIQTPKDQETPEYKELQKTLRKARNANRTKQLYVKYLYVTRPSASDENKFVIVVCPEEDPEKFAPVGDPNPGANNDFLEEHTNETYAFDKATSDPWGTWLTGYAPIYDSQGKYVGTVGADVSAAFVEHALNRVYIYGAVTLLISLLLAMIAATFLARRATKALRALKAATVEIGKGDFSHRLILDTKDEFADLANSLNQMSEGLEEKERLKIGFARYVSQHVLEKIAKGKGSAKLEGEKRKVTVFFSDIRGFTHIAESMEPEKVVALLNEYFKIMLGIIFEHNGMMDKLIGDGIMAEFGVPLDDPEQEKNAVITSIEMYRALYKLKEKWKSEGKPNIDIGIGIHTGEAIMGSVGSEQRMEYTAIGDTVNVASRLQQVSKEGKYPIIISQSTFNAVKHDFNYRALGPQTLPGRDHPVEAYAIIPPGFSID